jgi:putative tryptophan/tyrosine transport system substrate-binding protein
MRRRDFIAGLAGAAAWPLVARGQQSKVPVVGVLLAGASNYDYGMAAMLEGLKEGGYVEGRNLTVEYRFADGHNDRFPALVADLIRRQVSVIFAGGTPAALAAKAATTTIPVIFENGIDPVGAGLVPNLNRPGGNVTGVTNMSTTLAAKRLGLLHQLVPKAASIGVLVDPTAAASDTQRAELQRAADALGLQLVFLDGGNEQEIDRAFATLARQRTGALLLTDNPTLNFRREQLVTLARFNAIPTMSVFRDFAEAGGLISYATSVTDASRRAGNYVARILRGEKPGDLPVQLPTKFELVINLKTAKALSIDVPSSLLAIADQVIE